MFEILKAGPYGMVVEVVYEVMRRLYQRAAHQDENDGLDRGAPDSPENRALRVVLREIREAEGCTISQLSDEAARRYTHALSEILGSYSPPMTPERERRGFEILEEMREKYGRAA